MIATTSIVAIVVDPATILSGAGWSLELAALHLLTFALLIGVTLAWGRDDRRRLWVASGVITVCAVVFVFCSTVQPRDIPVEWITVLHHGLGRKTIMHLYARGAHAGGNFAFVLSTVAAGHAPTLRDVAWLNLLLALVNAAIFLHVAVYVTGPVWGVVWTLVFALNPATFLASFSELPTNLLALYFLMAVIAWTVLIDPAPRSPTVRGAAYALCVLLTLLVAFTRIDVAILGAVALVVHAAYALVGPEAWAAAGRSLRDICVRPLAFLDDHPAAVVALCAIGAWLSVAGLPWRLAGRSEMSGIYPFNPSILGLFFFLPMLALPIGVSIATLFGFVHAVIDFRRFAGLALSLFVLVRTYFAAQSQYYEMGRYLSYVLPSVFLLGLFGKEQFDEMARRWRPNWCRAARIAYLMAWCTLPLPGVLERYMRPEYHRGGGFAQLLLDRNTQREVRYLMALTERNPECLFVGRVVEDQHGDPWVAPQYDYVVFGAPIADPIVMPARTTPLAEVISRYAAGASCVRLYAGGDCNLNFSDRCRDFVAGRRLVDEYRFWSRPYNNPLESGYGAPEIVLATYEWR